MPDIDQPSEAEWSAIPSAVVSDCLGRFSAMSGDIRALSGEHLVGPAYPLQVVVGDNRSIHLALKDVPPGWVLVIDAGGYPDRAVWGGVLAEAARARGVAGVVIDGALRDVAELRQQGFPAFARGTSPAGPHKAGGGVAAETVSCGGVLVGYGDLIVGDLDGVAVVPRDRIAATLDAVRQRLQLEQEWLDRIRAGVPSSVVLGLE